MNSGKISAVLQPLLDHTNQAASAALFRVVNRYVGNLPPMPGVFPDYPSWWCGTLTASAR